MTQDETIELARQAGLHVATDVNWMPVIGLDYAKKLIELATEKERKEWAREFAGMGEWTAVNMLEERGQE